MIPQSYSYLKLIQPLPKMVDMALSLYGTHEGVGSLDNPTILSWAKEVGQTPVFTHDSIAWCGLFMAVVCKRAGYDPVDGPLWALNWSKFGLKAGQPILGDTLVFSRPTGGHVGLYVGEDSTTYYVLGGNTSDQVMIARIDKHRLVAARRPPYKAPSQLWKPIMLAANGQPISTNEA